MKLGEYQELYYVKKVDFGVYLAEDLTSETHVLLPAKQVPENAKTGEKIRVFLYKDSKDIHRYLVSTLIFKFFKKFEQFCQLTHIPHLPPTPFVRFHWSVL